MSRDFPSPRQMAGPIRPDGPMSTDETGSSLIVHDPRCPRNVLRSWEARFSLVTLRISRFSHLENKAIEIPTQVSWALRIVYMVGNTVDH